MDRNLLEYMPTIMKEFKEFQALTDAENPEVSSLWAVLEDIMNDQFINDSTENGVNRWETIMNITPKGTDNLDVRKFRLLTRLNEKIPYTLTTIEQQLVTLCGETGYTLYLDNGTYTLTVRIRMYASSKYDEVDGFLKRTVPANMIIDLSLLYNTYSQLSALTHNQMATYTHDQLRKEVI